MRVYLAGPEVFLPEAAAAGAAKKALCARYGLTGLYPLDSALSLDGLAPAAAGRAIFRGNIALMRDCDAVVANLTPFRGPGADVGTAFELGYMAALGRRVLAYSNSRLPYPERVRRWDGGGLRRRPDGSLADGRGLTVEEFDMSDNLMLDAAVEALVLHEAAPGAEFTDLTACEACLRRLAEGWGGNLL